MNELGKEHVGNNLVKENLLIDSISMQEFSITGFKKLFFDVYSYMEREDDKHLYPPTSYISRALNNYKKEIAENNITPIPSIIYFIDRCYLFKKNYHGLQKDKQVEEFKKEDSQYKKDLIELAICFRLVLKDIFNHGEKIYSKRTIREYYFDPNYLLTNIIPLFSSITECHSNMKKYEIDSLNKNLNYAVMKFEDFAKRNPTFFIPDELIDLIFDIKYYLSIEKHESISENYYPYSDVLQEKKDRFIKIKRVLVKFTKDEQP